MFTGTYTAIVTPFKNGQLDEAALDRLVRNQIKGGVDGIVPVGTTGESPTVSYEEHMQIVAWSVTFAARKIKVLAGTGANSTSEAIYLTQAAETAGADGSLQVAPYYNKPTQEGVYQHFRAIADASQKPVVLYNIAGRTGTNIETPTLRRLAEVPNILGVKEASGNISQIAEVCGTLPEDFLVFSGDDSITLAVIGLGGVGIISVASNAIPAEMTRMTQAALANKWDMARMIFRKYLPLMQAHFIESNPVPVKAVLSMLGRMEEVYRLPMCPIRPENRAKLEKVVTEVGLLQPHSVTVQ